MEVYRILQSIMDERSLSIPDVARACGLSDSTVRGIITRKQKSIALDVAVKLSQGLNVSIETLNGNDPTALETTEYPVMAKYRRLNDVEKDRIDELIDRTLSGQSIGDIGTTQKKPAPTNEDELDEAIIDMVLQLQLTPYELQRLADFAKGIAAAREVPPSGQHQNP